ncbi:hypothetical protein ABW20_dc0103703 [Dactylellina cionopaga]|nr:hypothetical protein ABW20_dc0103703 [Dactylellina cionopaga]
MPLAVFHPNITVTVKSTAFKTITKTALITTTIVSKTVTVTSFKIASTKISISTLTSTSTSILTKTSVRTVNAACATPLILSKEISSLNVQDDTTAVVANDFKACCNLCFKTLGCNSYKFVVTSPSTSTSGKCTLRFSKNKAGCETSYCPLGKQLFEKSNTAYSATSWGTGPCYGGIRT